MIWRSGAGGCDGEGWSGLEDREPWHVIAYRYCLSINYLKGAWPQSVSYTHLDVYKRQVDASQGVEAQTVANTFLAAGHNLTILPVINKIDLPAAQPEVVKEQIESVLAISADDALMISAKSGLGVEDVLEAIVKRIPPPKGNAENPLQALIFDSWFDIYLSLIHI